MRNVGRTPIAKCLALAAILTAVSGVQAAPRSPAPWLHRCTTARLLASWKHDGLWRAAAVYGPHQEGHRVRYLGKLQAGGRRYKIYVTNVAWHHRLFFAAAPGALGATIAYGLGADSFLSGADFAAGRLVHWTYVPAPPRTLAFFCAHELTHIITAEHVGIVRFYEMPDWVREGFPDYVGIEHRESFERLRDELGARPEDSLLRAIYGSYPRYRLLVTYFLEKKRWSLAQLLRTDLTQAEATAIMLKGR